MNRLLEDVAMLDDYWSRATQNLFNRGLDMKEEAYRHGFLLAAAVVLEVVKIDEIHRDASKYNQLDREAVMNALGSIENYRDCDYIADYIEASGRRMAHHALHQAYRRTRAAEDRTTFRCQNRHLQPTDILKLLNTQVN